MDFTENNIHGIKKLCEDFIEEHYEDEEIYFDEFWKIYEPALQLWVGKPPPKWRLKISKRRFPRVIGMADNTQAIELVTPKILEVVATTYTYIARIKEKLTLTKVEEILKKCVKKLPESERKEIVVFFAPRILRDLQEVEGLPEEEVKKEYVLFSNTYQRGKHLSKDEYFLKKSEIEKMITEYSVLINEVTGEFYIEGYEQKILPSQKKALKVLIKGGGNIILYKDLYEAITGLEIKEKRLQENDRNLVHKVIYDFRSERGKKIKELIEVVRGEGYKFLVKKSKYCLIEFVV